MAIQTTEGIILRKQNLRETSVILTFLTKDFGKISGIIRGARGPKAAIGTNPQVFSLNDIVFYERKRGNLSSISQCDLKNFFEPIRNDLERTIYADYFLELADAVTVEGDVDRDAYELLLNSLLLLSGPASAKRAARIFEIKLMEVSGLLPELRNCSNCGAPAERDCAYSLKLGGLLCGKCRSRDTGAIKVSNGTMNFIERVKKTPFEMLARIKVSQDVGRELEGFLRKFVDYQVGRPLKTLGFLKKVKM
jgi:DNA repair protein RecO (recombination protein O)